MLDLQGPCPCGSGEAYAQCCQPIHVGDKPAATPEALMRSRYTAFALGFSEYLKASWSVLTRPEEVELDPAQEWTRLRILDAPAPEGNTGYVRFRAHYKYRGERGYLEEHSRFSKENGEWVYVDGEIFE